MKTKGNARRFWCALAAWPALMLPVGLLAQQFPGSPAQVIRIKLVNARNGKPITDGCLNVFVAGSLTGQSMAAGSGQGGLVRLRVLRGWVVAETPCSSAPKGWRTKLRLPAGQAALVMWGVRYIACQELGVPGTASRLPKYPINEILSKGMVSGNTCGKIRAKPVPGELIFFERPLTFWEKMTR